MDVIRCSVVQCFIPTDFNEEPPLYVLDLGGMLLILFGQWLYDPNVMTAPDDIFEAWSYDKTFFSNFSLRCALGRSQ